jgi:SAM-dependent methyltransferase
MHSLASDAALERLELVLGGHVFFQTLRTAVELDLFTLLGDNPGASLEQLAALTGIAIKPMRIVLLGCVALELISKRGSGYYNTPLAEVRLRRDRPGNIVSTVEFAHRLVYRPMFHFSESVRANTNVGLSEIPGEGRTLYDRIAADPELERVFHAGLEATSALNVEQLLDCVDLSDRTHVLDVGGGNGTALCSLVRRHPLLRGTVLETPTVCALARARIAAAGLADRIAIYPANGFTDPFPRGADCILLMHFLTIWSEETNAALMRKSFEALPPGGTVVVFDGAQMNDGTGPIRAARWSPYFLVVSSGEGMFYSPDEYAGWMRQAGFESIRQHQTAKDHVVTIGRHP